MNVGNALKVTCVGFAGGIVLRVIQMLYCFDYETGFYTDSGVMAGCCLGFVTLASLLGGVMCFCGRRYFGSYEPRKNTGLGVTAAISGVLLLVSAAVQAVDYLGFLQSGRSAYDSVEWSGLHLVFLLSAVLFGAVQIYMSLGFFRGQNNLEKVPLLYLAAVLWGIVYMIVVYVFYARFSSFVENVFSVVSAAAVLMCLFYLCKLFAGVDAESAARRVFVTGIFAVVFTVTYCFSNLALRMLGRSYSGEIPVMIQLSVLGVALFQLTFLVTFRRYSLRRSPKGDTQEIPVMRETDAAAGPAAQRPDAPSRRPSQKRGGRRVRPN